MKHPTCAWVRSRLPLFAGGDHRASEDARIRAHLVACGPCRLELGPFLRARRALVEAAADAPGTPDLEAMHRDVMAAVERLPAPAAGGPRALRAGLLAAGLFCVGLIAVQWAGGKGAGFFERAPLTPASAPPGVEDFGERLRPLGHQPGVPRAVGTGTQGLMGRLRLRTLEFEGVLPQLPPELRETLEEPPTGK